MDDFTKRIADSVAEKIAGNVQQQLEAERLKAVRLINTLAKIAESAHVRPGHVAYMSKTTIGTAARAAVDEYDATPAPALVIDWNQPAGTAVLA